jgi:CRISPR-associated protein Csm2
MAYPQKGGQPPKHKNSNEMDDEGKKLLSDFDPQWITERFARACSLHADAFALYLKRAELTRTQVRNFFGELRRIEARGAEKSGDEIGHLRHKLAYTKSRLDDLKLPPNRTITFQKVLEKALDAIPEDRALMPKAFSRFVSYFEAVLAYHRYHGGRDK